MSDILTQTRFELGLIPAKFPITMKIAYNKAVSYGFIADEIISMPGHFQITGRTIKDSFVGLYWTHGKLFGDYVPKVGTTRSCPMPSLLACLKKENK